MLLFYLCRICRFLCIFYPFWHADERKSVEMKCSQKASFILSRPVPGSQDRDNVFPVSRDKNFAVPSKGLIITYVNHGWMMFLPQTRDILSCQRLFTHEYSLKCHLSCYLLDTVNRWGYSLR